MSIKVLVTGANGQLGKTIKELYDTNSDQVQFVFTTKKELNIIDENKVAAFLNKSNFNYCINCAAYTNVEQAEIDPKSAFKTNTDAVKYLAQNCNDNKIVLIHISTDYVFDGEKEKPYLVSDIPNPINVYGQSKLEGEKEIKKHLKEYFIIRTSWLYSKKYDKNFYRTIIKKAQAGETLKVLDSEYGCPTNTENLSKYIYDLVIYNSKDYGIKHFCDSKVMTWFDFALETLNNNNLSIEKHLVKTSKYITFAKRPKYSVLQNYY